RASVRAWLYRIATNRCLNALRDRGRRPGAALPEPPFRPPAPTRWDESAWLEPYPDAWLGGLADEAPGPAAPYEAREAVALVLVAAPQPLPPRQRAALVLRDVLAYSAGETAAALGTSEASVKGALQRARATLKTQVHAAGSPPLPGSDGERALAHRVAEAFAADDIAGVIDLLYAGACLTMPPYPHAYQGRDAIGRFLRASAAWRGPRRYTLVPTRANRQPAFGCYLDEADAPVARAAGLIVLALA